MKLLKIRIIYTQLFHMIKFLLKLFRILPIIMTTGGDETTGAVNQGDVTPPH
jgi:hypothetical protein